MRWPWQRRRLYLVQAVLSARFTGTGEAAYAPVIFDSWSKANAQAQRLQRDHGPGMLARIIFRPISTRGPLTYMESGEVTTR